MSNGREIGTVIGAVVVGYFTAGTGYAAFATAVGGAVGGAIGSTFDPDVVNQGPRIDDLKVSVSTYGIGKPLCYGSNMLGGNWLWATDKIELPFVSSGGGGKGGGGDVSNVSYRYFIHGFMGLCQTPPPGTTIALRKVFVDGKLQWDASSGVSVGSALASAENPFAGLELFMGYEDQDPIAFIELNNGGPGSTPAYRGTVGLLIVAMECPDGRVPQISVELVMNADVSPESSTFSTITDPVGPGPTFDLKYTGVIGPQFVEHYPRIVQGGPTSFTAFTLGPGYSRPDAAYTTQYVSELNYQEEIAVNGSHTSPQSVRYYGPPSGPGTMEYWARDLRSGSERLLDSSPTDDGRSIVQQAAYDVTSGRYALSVRSDTTALILPDNTFSPAIPSASFATGMCFYDSKLTIAYHPTASNELRLLTQRSFGGSWITVSDVSVETPASGSNCRLFSEGEAVYVRTYVGTTAGNVYKVLDGVVTLLANIPTAGGGTDYERTFYANDDYIIVGPFKSGGVSTYSITRLRVPHPQEVKAKDVIADLIERSGETRYDVSALPDSDTLWGIKYANPASARANMDPILMGFGYYVVDEDGLIKVKRYEDITSVADVAYDELGQSEDGESGDPMPLVRRQEIDLTRSVTVNYLDPTFDYQTTSEISQREVTQANQDKSVDLVMSTNSDRAKTVADMILYAEWRSQNTRGCKVSRKFAFLSPGDGATVEYPRGTLALWRITAMNDTGAVIELSLEPGDASLYTKIGVGQTGYVGQQVTPLIPPTRLQLLDMPIVRDEDNNASLYAAMDGYADGWTGAALLVGDDDTNLASRGTVDADAPIGFAETVLAYAPSSFVDEKNLFTVNIGDNEFSDCTRDVLLSGGGEYWAYGAPGRWEIGASALSDDLGDGRLILSRHLRGQFGTEWAASLHQLGDVFVLLHINGMLRPSSGVGELGQNKSYRAVSKGRSSESVTSTVYANTGEGLKPLSPVNLRRTDTNDLTVDRRSRLAMNNSTGTLPIGEAAEAYSWSFYTDGTYASRIGTALTTTSTVTAAQITAAGATPSSTLYVRVAMLSDQVGLGHELQASK